MAQAEKKIEEQPESGDRDDEAPSMEEILRSIRGVIADDEPEKEEESVEAEGENVLELTDVVEETQEEEKSILDDIDAALGDEEKEEASKSDADNTKKDINIEQLLQPVEEGGDRGDSLLKDSVAHESSVPIKDLVDTVHDKYPPSPVMRNGTSLEDLVIEAIRPFLADWLNANLPDIVRKIVEKEVRRLVPKDD